MKTKNSYAYVLTLLLAVSVCLVMLMSVYACFEDKEPETVPEPPTVNQEDTVPSPPSNLLPVPDTHTPAPPPDNKPKEHPAPDTGGLIPAPETLPLNPLPPYADGEHWRIDVVKTAILAALSDMGIRVATLTPITADEVDSDGLAKILNIGGRAVDAYLLTRKLNIPSTRFERITVAKDKVTFEGRGSFAAESD